MSLRLQVELVHHAGCANVAAARAILSRALWEVGAPAVWTEWVTDDPACPEEVRGYGSPTILVNRKDVAPAPGNWELREDPAAPRCRVYRVGDESLGTPPVEKVIAALMEVLGPDVV